MKATPPADPRAVSDLVERGDAAFAVDDFAGAGEYYRQARALDPDNPQVLARLGFCRWEEFDPAGAEALVVRALALAPENSELRSSVARYWMGQKEWERASVLWREAVRLNPSSLDFLLGEAECRLRLNHLTGALAICGNVMARKPSAENRYTAMVLTAQAFLNEGKSIEAREYALKAIRMNQEYPEGYRILALCPIAAVPPQFTAQTAGPGRPDIILLSIDTLRADRLGCYGNPRPVSPAIDGFSREAVLFRRVVSQSPHTAPSHMTVLTGMLPDVHQVVNFGGDYPGATLSPCLPTMAEILSSAGYYCAAFVGKGNLPPFKGFSRGFDRYEESFDEFTDGSDVIPPGVDEVLRDAQQDPRPLFLFVHHLFVHAPYIYGPPEIRDRFLTDDIRVPGLPIEFGDVAAGGQTLSHDRFWENIDISDPAHREHVLALYDGGILFADRIFQDLVGKLKKAGRYDNALIVLFSDHGEEFGEHGGREHGRLFVEHLLVPLIIKFPGAKFSGHVVSQPVRLIDILPTIFGVNGCSANNIEGKSLLGLLRDENRAPIPLISYSTCMPGCTRIEVWPYSYSDEGAERLFEIATDPGEQRDVGAALPERLEEFRRDAREQNLRKAAYVDRMGSSAGEPAPLDPDLKRRLRALGYL
ncbi:MAG TPA: sulfatase-like hydrolase/transferase [bacterium]|nr:sulfatase-like hydrolase/transferase [bacterium]HPJ71168.1 sulfatase-like hydrolase/transferase [bacterium]HPQ65169.1 sulfatase-like hydrolase/transferase [bacterium]